MKLTQLLICSMLLAVPFVAGAQRTTPMTPTERQKAYGDLAKYPDWDGTWSTVRGKDPAPILTPAGQKMKADYEAGQAEGRNLQVPAANCVPDGVPRIMRLYPIEFLFTPGRLTIGIETYSQTRRIYMDGRPMPEDPDPTFNGTSIARWDGDTLVIDTIALTPQNAGGIARGLKFSEQAKVQERIRLESPDRLIDQVTVTDPAILAEPWVYTQAYQRHRDWDMREYICSENNRDAADPFGRPSLSLDPTPVGGE